MKVLRLHIWYSRIINNSDWEIHELSLFFSLQTQNCENDFRLFKSLITISYKRASNVKSYIHGKEMDPVCSFSQW